jgi:hypothetical protein
MTTLFLIVALVAGYYLLTVAIRDIRAAISANRAWNRLQAEIDGRAPAMTQEDIREFHQNRWEGD